jgi:hypothetical protein
MPPFKVRRAKEINDQLGQTTLPFGFTALPVVTYINPSVQDDCSYNGCSYCVEAE